MSAVIDGMLNCKKLVYLVMLCNFATSKKTVDMKNAGAIRFLAIVFALVCLYHLSFTYCTRRVEKQAREYSSSPLVYEQAKQLAQGNSLLEKFYADSISNVLYNRYLDSMSSVPVMNILIRKYTYKECKEREINLGLDLRGGMHIVLEVSMDKLIIELSGHNTQPEFLEAIRLANERQRTSQENYVDIFGKALKELAPDNALASYFLTENLRGKIQYNTTDQEVLRILKREVDEAFDRTFEVLRNRIDRFGVSQPNIQKLAFGNRILIELPGIKDPERVRKLLQGAANLEFWETWEFGELYQYFEMANERLATMMQSTVKQTEQQQTDTVQQTTTSSQLEIEQLLSKTQPQQTSQEQAGSEHEKKYPLYSILRPAFVANERGEYYPQRGPVCGYAAARDTARVNQMLRLIKDVFPRDVKFVWSFKPTDVRSDLYQLIALKVPAKTQAAPLTGSAVVDAYPSVDQMGRAEVIMVMNAEGAKIWKRLTADNIGRSIAIVLDDKAYSWPTVQSEIPTGRSTITGTFTVEETQDFATKLKSGKLAAPVRVVEEAIVGPSLGRESIRKSLLSFVFAFILVLLYMIFFYSGAGVVANVALLSNVFFLFGVLASLQAVLTLPGIAGIILTLGMSVDANVIIYERVKEELKAGKGLRLAIEDGYKNAYSAIIDGNVTTLLVGIILYLFGSGPVQGFATTLIIGIITSLFSAIFITRLIFVRFLDKNKKIQFSFPLTENFLARVNIDFLKKRKIAYVVSSIVIVIGIISLFSRGLNLGVDFSGGRSYIVRFDQDVRTVDVARAIAEEIEQYPEVKTFGANNQVKITTKYLIDSPDENADSIAERKIFNAIQKFYKTPITFDEFRSDDPSKMLGRLSSQKVGPTIARDIRRDAVLAVIFSLVIMFAYMALRFKRWQYGFGALVALFHDAFITISIFSIFYGILPFNMEIDQAFIAAILTIIGYSVNDTVIVFDRVREILSLYPKRPYYTNMNDAINKTLSRTINTAGTTLIVLLAIFIFGGEVIRGFTFALLIGIIVGTYSSIFVASPIAYDIIRRKQQKE